MDNSKPTNEQWAALYDAAAAFKQTAPWDWMADSDIFGVQDPETGKVGYCCILGALGQVLGLNVYLGAEGLDTYLKLQTGEMAEDDPDILYSQDVLVVHWEDRSGMAPEDLQVIRSLGLKFRGKKGWPWFRRFEPGFPPGPIHDWEAGFLTLALRQAMDLTLKLKEKASILPPPENGTCLVRVPEIKEGNLLWWDEEQPFPVLLEKEVQVPPVDELRLKKLKGRIQRSGEIWEGDYFYGPAIIMEGDRPYFPYTAVWVNQGSGQILAVEFFPHSGFASEFQNQFLSLLEQLKAAPQEIRVKKIEILQLLQPITDQLNIPVALQKKLPNLEEARQAMTGFLSRE